jgi:hypothetical protein
MNSQPPPAEASVDRRRFLTGVAAVARADLQVVSTVSGPDAPESTFASFLIEDGQPGAHRR